jgi:LacI family transcriptional regulator
MAATRAAARLGLRVPEDLSLITFANDMTVIHSMQITCAELPERRVGALAAEMLMQKIAEPGQPLASVAVPMGWYRGASCAPPPPLS